MPDSSALSMTGARVEAVAGKALLANSVLHLFKDSLTPTPTTTLAQFAAAECDFDGYVALTIATWSDPVLSGAAYVIYAPTQTFPWTFATGVGNQVGGAYLVTAAGDQYQYTVFSPSRPCMGPDQAVITTPADLFPAG